jgi:hypothetical protein
MASKAKIFLLALVMGGLLSCQAHSHERDKKVLAILSDFTFVGSGQAKFNSDGSIDTAYRLDHGETEQPRPQSIEIGKQYVFHHRVPMDNEILALHDLPDRITQMGFKIINAPKSNSGLLYLYYGGPIFRIEFADGNREFTVFNQLNTSHSNAWSIHDYILVRIR